MRYDPARFCIEHNIPHWTGGKNVRYGWTHIQCPMCDDESNHGGFNPDSGGYACWRCGTHNTVRVIMALLGLQYGSAKALWDGYSHGSSFGIEETKRVEPPEAIQIPGKELNKQARAYLESRGFDPARIAKEYGVKSTGAVCEWEGSDFRLRLVVPIYNRRGKLVSFQARDYTNKQDLRYKGCPVEKAVQHYKEGLYNSHRALGDKVVVVEGIFDVWRMGNGFVASYGTSLMPAQLNELSKWEEIYFMFDPEEQAQRRARKYAEQLAGTGKSVYLLDAGKMLKGRDPAELEESEALKIRRELGI